MANLFIILLLYILSFIEFTVASNDQEIPFGTPDRHQNFLDPQGNYFLEWNVHWDSKLVIFSVVVKTNGYIGLGLSKNGKFNGADIVIGGVYPNSTIYFADYHGTSNGVKLDQIQNLILIEQDCMENETHTVLSFKRLFDTCDKQDISMNNNTRYILWAYGETDDFSQFPGNNNGAFVTYMLDIELTPWSIKQFNRGVAGSTPELGNSIERWNIKQTFDIPTKRTTYWCSVKKFVSPGRRHIIGQNVRINPEARIHVHQMLILRCVFPFNPFNVPLDLYFDLLSSLYPGEECYNLAEPSGFILTPFCSELKGGYAIGQRPVFYQAHVGVPIGDLGTPNEYFLLQVHYDNPENLSNITVKMDIDLYLTDKLRKNEVSAFGVGHPFPGSPSILVPLQSQNHAIYGHCSNECTQTMFPPEGVRVIGAYLHAHNAGRKMRLQHFRNGVELPYILSDDNFQFQFQTVRGLREEVVLLPGDQLTMTCYYDTTTASKSVVGGYSTDQEMCIGMISVYKRIDAFPLCESQINSVEYMKRYLNGTEKLQWNQTILEYQRIKPLPLNRRDKELFKKSVSEISDHFVNWNADLRRKLKCDHLTMEQQTFCPNVNDYIALAFGFILPPTPKTTSYPINAKPYQPPEQCTKPENPIVVPPQNDLHICVKPNVK